MKEDSINKMVELIKEGNDLRRMEYISKGLMQWGLEYEDSLKIAEYLYKIIKK